MGESKDCEAGKGGKAGVAGAEFRGVERGMVVEASETKGGEN
jgi:hypothetical protein